MQKLIYIADDEQNIRMMMKTFLENEGYAVEVFGDGYSIRKAVHEKIDVYKRQAFEPRGTDTACRNTL